MMKFAFTTAAVLLALAPSTIAEEATPAKNTDAACCTADGSCKPDCPKPDKDAKDKETAWLDIETITVEAANGDPIAQYTIAYLTETGNDTTKPDSDKAAEWYSKSLPGLEKAAAEGNACACRALAHMYGEGKGVEKNHEMADKYWKMYKKLMKEKHSKECCPKCPEPAKPETKEQ